MVSESKGNGQYKKKTENTDVGMASISHKNVDKKEPNYVYVYGVRE
jgi:hypothetical protein